MTTEREDTAAPLPDASTIHERGLERARRIVATYRAAEADIPPGPGMTAHACSVAFQAAADALHEEADAAAEARKRGHKSLTDDLRNTAGRIVGIAQDLLELSKMDEQPDTVTIHMDNRAGTYTPATDPVIKQADVAEHLARLEAAHGTSRAPDHTWFDESHVTTTEQLEQIEAYLRGDTDAPPADVTPEQQALINASDDAGREAMQPALAFADPEPYRPAAGGAPFPGAESHRYDYAALMTPVPADRVPAHWSWSQLTTLEDCGVQYRGQRLDGIPQQPQWANVGGTTFHTVTEAFDRGAWAAGGADLLPEVHPELIKSRWEDTFAAAIDCESQVSGIEMGQVGDNWRASNGGKEGYTWWLIEGERMLELYIHNRRRLDKLAREAGTLAVSLELLTFVTPGDVNGERKPVIEYPYERKLPGPTGTLTIKGIIDRAYRCVDGTIIIKDLKTGRMPADTAQLGEYAWAIADLLIGEHATAATSVPLPKIMGCFYDARKALFTEPIDLLERHPHEEYVYRYHAAEAVRYSGVFMPHRSTFCAGCSIRYACPVGGA
jgi:hypothetical protein